MPKANRKLRWIILAVATFVLAVAGIVAYRVFGEPGYTEFKAGKAAYQAGDYKSAVEHYKLAAEQGNLKARTLVGIFYRKGMGVEQDYDEAVKWYRKVAEQGNYLAQYEIGKCYHEGKGVEKDTAEAVKWYRLAAEQDNTDAKEALKELGINY